jgi:hypothetical protein
MITTINKGDIMAGSKTGTPAIIQAARKISRMVRKYGAADLEANTAPAFKVAVFALIAACALFDSLDNNPGQVDRVAPDGPEDVY